MKGNEINPSSKVEACVYNENELSLVDESR